MSQYTVLVVDPPWSYGSATGRTRTAEHHYETLGNAGKEINRKSGEGIQSIIDATPVPSFSAKDAHLYLWTTNPKLPFTFEVMRAWGFEYKTMLTWVKTRADGRVHGGGMGWFFRGATEHVLFGVKGNKGIPSALRRPNVFLAPTGEHSEKPAAFYDLLRGIYPADERMVDMYARKSHPRFYAWGDEAPRQCGSAVMANGARLSFSGVESERLKSVMELDFGETACSFCYDGGCSDPAGCGESDRAKEPD